MVAARVATLATGMKVEVAWLEGPVEVEMAMVKAAKAVVVKAKVHWVV